MTMLSLPRAADQRARKRDVFERVVLAVDFGSASLAAARWATTYVAPRAEALLAHVAPPNGAGAAEAIELAGPRQRTSAAISGGLDGFAATLPVASATSVTRIGGPSHWLSAIANDADASLLVLGRRADANRTRVGEPNVIERATRRTSASVLVVPEGTTEPLVHVLAAVDESDAAAGVLDVARRLARMHEVPLTVVYVLSPAADSYARVPRPPRRQMHGRVLAVETARTPSTGGLPAHTARWLLDMTRSSGLLERDRALVRIGDPVREITATASAVSSTLVVVGMRGADGAPSGSIGSVARELLTRAPMPVLAINRRANYPELEGA
jgi:nucleotide-binding universal stress UspA family protein